MNRLSHWMGFASENKMLLTFTAAIILYVLFVEQPREDLSSERKKEIIDLEIELTTLEIKKLQGQCNEQIQR